jgi:serine/threonine protein kinase
MVYSPRREMSSPSPSDVPPRPDRCGPFDLLHRIDEGGMGEIYLARRGGGCPAELVALKRIRPSLAKDPSFVGMFTDEGRLAVLLRHENICEVKETGEDQGAHYLVMEWIHGVSVRSLLSRLGSEGHVPTPIAVRIAQDVAKALHYAHELVDDRGQALGVVHRDVSPPNVMLRFDGTVKLLDFGLAKARNQAHKTLPGVVKGKFRYLAPEQTHPGPVDRRADVFALGLCLYEMLSGKALFDQSGDLDTVLAVRNHEAPPRLSDERKDVPSAVDEVLRVALAGNRDERYETAGAFAGALRKTGLAASRNELREFLARHFAAERPQVDIPDSALAAEATRLPAPSASPSVAPRPAGAPRRWRLAVAAAVLLLVAAAAAWLAGGGA